QEKAHRRRQGGRVAGFAYLNSPRDARALLTRVTNLMIVGDRKDENYRLALEARSSKWPIGSGTNGWDRRPQSPSLRTRPTSRDGDDERRPDLARMQGFRARAAPGGSPRDEPEGP